MSVAAAAFTQDKPARLLLWLYRRLGRRYPALFLTAELHTALAITAATLGLLSFYYEASLSDYLLLLAIAEGLSLLSIWIVLVRTYPLLRPVERWIGGERDPRASVDAWAAAISLPLEMIKRERKVPLLVVVLPAAVATAAVLGLSWPAVLPITGAGLVALGYSMILHYLALEAGMRPVLVDINRVVPPRTRANVSSISLRTRMLVALPLINVITGLVVAALTSNGGGGAALGGDVLIAVGVATTISLELTVMFARSILRPIADLTRATERVLRGRYDVSVPITTGDELGELTATFNQMVAGLAERERIREAFGTYLDHEVAEYILSEEFNEEGEEQEVSILFMDVRDFTSFAAQADAKEVVARLNALFEAAVPVIARHGGHVDKFVGDGLMAVFGAPERFPDHADRAIRAACELVATINGPGGPGLRIGIGVNTGSVIAGSIGGAGRLNFSVVGDAVNVASRVEAETRETGDDVLITAATKAQLSGDFECEPRGRHDLKGLGEPVELYTVRLRAGARAGDRGAAAFDEPLPLPDPGARDGGGRAAPARQGGIAPL